MTKKDSSSNFRSSIRVEVKGTVGRNSLLDKIKRREQEESKIQSDKELESFVDSNLNDEEKKARLKILENANNVTIDNVSNAESIFCKPKQDKEADNIDKNNDKKEELDKDIILSDTEQPKQSIIDASVDVKVKQEKSFSKSKASKDKTNIKLKQDLEQEKLGMTPVTYGFVSKATEESGKSDDNGSGDSHKEKISSKTLQDSLVLKKEDKKSNDNPEQPSQFLKLEKSKYKRSGKGNEQNSQEVRKPFKRGSRHRNHRKLQKISVDYTSQPIVAKEISIPDTITVAELANRMSVKSANIVKTLMDMGMVITANQMLEAEVAELVVEEYKHIPKRLSAYDLDLQMQKQNDDEVNKAVLKGRSPVVTVMGHVDHGKTSLLDALRSTLITEKEAGGITQHIGASTVEVKDGKFITFLDTPGHEAFTSMRKKGANITDIVILVVAADDGLKEQTIEAIKHAQAAKVPMIVAINKMDKPGANPEKIKNQLLEHSVILESLGGDVLSVEISALKKQNLDKLEEAILLQAEMMNLQANYDQRAIGSIIEAKLDKKIGVVVSILVKQGTLKQSDVVVAGRCWGKIRRMVDDKGKAIKEALPSMAVEIYGFFNVPESGIRFDVVADEKKAREIALLIEQREKNRMLANKNKKSVSDILAKLNDQGINIINFMIKADVRGSCEAIENKLLEFKHDEIKVNIVYSGIGSISNSDIDLAEVSDAIILAFNVKLDNNIRSDMKDVAVKYYNVIYDLFLEVEQIITGNLKPIIKEDLTGYVEVLKIFPLAKTKVAVGCAVRNGVVNATSLIKVKRGDEVIHKGKIQTLKHLKNEVKEVKQGTECGIELEKFFDFKEGDIIESYNEIEEKRSL